MPAYDAILSEAVVIARPRCPKCGTRMWLTRIAPTEKLDEDRRSYECPGCAHEISEDIKYR